MSGISSLFLKAAAIWFVIGISVGMQMGISGDHSNIDAHAHINLLGWVSSAIFGIYYRSDTVITPKLLRLAHFSLYNAGLLLMLPGLYFAHFDVPGAETAVGVGSSLVYLGVLAFAAAVFSARRPQRA